jgi:hypothetical protein
VDWEGAHEVSEKSDTDFLWTGRLGLSYGLYEYEPSSVPAADLAVGAGGFLVGDADVDVDVADGGALGVAGEAG